jgi:cyclic beta-1,2-glucan synthetase
MLDPIRHGDSAAAIATYKVEPYVIAADVYTNPQHAGRGGWTWYTGSAAWMYRLIVESLLGLRLEVDHLRVAPLVPPEWQEFTVHYRHRRSLHHIHVRRLGPGSVVSRITLDGVVQPDDRIPLRDDGEEHRAEVDLGGFAGMASPRSSLTVRPRGGTRGGWIRRRNGRCCRRSRPCW